MSTNHATLAKLIQIPSKEQTEKLKARNLQMQAIIKEKIAPNKITRSLDLAIDKNFVDKFYIGCKQ